MSDTIETILKRRSEKVKALNKLKAEVEMAELELVEFDKTHFGISTGEVLDVPKFIEVILKCKG